MLETVSSHCPYCGEPIELVVDCSIPEQRYVEDCFVCCQPIVVELSLEDDYPVVALSRENE